METQKNQNSSVVDSKRLDRFIHRISGTRETPELIQLVAGSGEWMGLTRELSSITPEKDTDLWRQFSRACQRKNIDPINLKERLIPVAQSLGLIMYGKQQDYYTLLGIDPSASPEEIRKAYHRKAKSLHPDTRKTGRDDQAFIQLTDGYRILKDPVIKINYDQSRQSMGAWHESPVRMSHGRDEAGRKGRKSRRNRYFLQLSGVVVLMISAVFFFNLIYESSAINDGFYIPLQPEKSIPDLNEKSQEADRVIGRFEQNDSKEEFLSSDLNGRITSIPSVDVEKKLAGASTEISHSDKKQVVQSGPMASSDEKVVLGDEKARSTVSKELETKPEVEKTLSFFKKNENHEVIENTVGSVTAEQRDRAPQALADISTEAKKQAVENKKPSLHEENKAENDREKRNRQSASLEGVQDTAHSASELLRKFAEEDSEIKRVVAFIRKYSEIYERKNYSEFSRLFTEDATENGQAFSELATEYRRIFTAIDKFEYKIELHRTSLLVDQDIIRTAGIYKIAWQPSDGVYRESEGPISFEIVKRNGEYRVQKLKYGEIDP